MRRSIPLAGLVVLALLGACSSDDGGSSTGSSGAPGTSGGGAARCEVGTWTSTVMTAPTQAGLGEVTPAGGGDGMRIAFGENQEFQIDFGPMQPSTATFDKAGQQGTLATTLAGVEKGTWTVDGQSKVVGTTDDLTTATAKVEITLGETVPPVFEGTFQYLNENRMLGDEKVGVFTVTACQGDTLTMSTPFPGGVLVIDATRAG